jgi:membrane associated rhomboid family serine protease
MKQTIFEEIKYNFKNGSQLNKLILINIGIYLIINILKVLFFLFQIYSIDIIVAYLAVPAEIMKLLYKPWTLITYMFTHIDFLHILFNMLWLYWFGKIFIEYIGDKKIFTTYILGGLSGAILYILSYNIFPVFNQHIQISTAIGASASVLAIVIATAAYIPDYTVNLMFIGNVKLKYIALFTIILDFFSITGENPGGHIAHLGGALWGYIYILQLKKGHDTVTWINKIFKKKQYIKKVKSSKKRYVSDEEYNYNKFQQQKKIDEILEKISRSGYESLTKNEKEILFKMSKKK